ncbi:hypothetical protein QTN94_14290 [Vibrio sp. M250220]|uniref:hypothetical protein n=1 Tax=Vibrio sp. M250220 TaxID=3020894 RepID=UPI002F422FBA
MEKEIQKYLFTEGYRHSIRTVRLLTRIAEHYKSGNKLSITEVCKELEIHRSYWYELTNKHKSFLEGLKNEKIKIKR